MLLKNAYLVAYNAVAVTGWAYLLLLQLHYVTTIRKSSLDLYERISFPLLVCQTLAILEIAHATFGWVKSNVVVTAMQVFSRLFIVWGIVYVVPEVHGAMSIYLFLVSWCITEVIRYSYYALSLLGCVPYVLCWLRYTLFIALYPAGVAGELITTYLALAPIRRRQILSVDLPNSFNMSFNYYYITLLIMALYLPGFPQLYRHMFVQRAKVLSGQKAKST